MPETAMVLPILPGKRPALAAFARALSCERKAEYEASQTTVTKENWFVQSTPQADLLVVCFEAPDIQAVLSGLADSREPFDVWFKAQVLDITGVDPEQIPEGVNEQVFHWARR